MPGASVPHSSFPQAPVPNTPRPSPYANMTSVTPDAARPTPPSSTMPSFESNAAKRTSTGNPDVSFPPQNGSSAPTFESFPTRGVPPRPQSASSMQSPSSPSFNTLTQDAQRVQSPLRASRLVTDPLARDGVRGQAQSQTALPPRTPQTPVPGLQRETPSSGQLRQLAPGMLLRGGRYRLQELQERQDWLSGVYEARWIAQDGQRNGSPVVVCELVLPENNSMVMQSTLRTATMALTAVGRHPHIPTLWDAFSDQGRNFFVFEPIEGESLMARMRRTGRAMQEQDVIECCLQMTEVLELLAQQSPPLVHGLIRPEHIVISRHGPQFMLTNFSIVLAGGATQFVSGIDRTRLSAYTAPEFVRGLIDARTDLYALLATAYHTVTGSAPAGVSGSIPQAQRINQNVSAQLDAILGKGLRPISSQRYQRPSELRQDLLAMRSVSSTLVPNSGQRPEPTFRPQPHMPESRQPGDNSAQSVQATVAQAFQSIAPAEEEERKSLLPRPEELPPMPMGNDMVGAGIWVGLFLLGLIILVALAHGFF